MLFTEGWKAAAPEVNTEINGKAEVYLLLSVWAYIVFVVCPCVQKCLFSMSSLLRCDSIQVSACVFVGLHLCVCLWHWYVYM